MFNVVVNPILLLLIICNAALYVWFGPSIQSNTGFWAVFLMNLSFFIYLRWRFLKVCFQTLPRDIKGVKTLLTVESAVKKEMKKCSTIDSIFHEHVSKYGDKIACINAETNEKLTFVELEHLTNRVTNYFQAQGLAKGDAVAIFMNNRIDYVAFWLGLSKLGVVSALINYNLRLQPLGHCVAISKAKWLIVDSELQHAVIDAVKNGDISSDVRLLVYGGPVHRNLAAENFEELLRKSSKKQPLNLPERDFKRVLMYIYTSGTTGMPKAAVITNARYFMMAIGAAKSFDITAKDRIYVCMPMYHSLAGIAGIGQTLVNGVTAVIRKKFSASRFWDDCFRHECTVTQYIGEICRYLLAQPSKPTERRHRLRLMFGNGLRQQIWTEFVDRFNIPRIGELYASTEGNTSLLNLDNKVGACGFFPVYPYVHLLYPLRLIKVDENTGQAIRNSDGLCVPCKPGEYGEMVGKIIKGNPVKEFHGYLSSKDTDKKMIRDVFNKGDVAFSSGDILFMDEKGYLYFKDRTGDTFRWKGENVSTTEVEGIIHKIIGLEDAIVYGVVVPEMEGKAGMTAMVDANQNTNLSEFNEKLKESLPSYARPVFLRLCKEVETTGTYKLKKQELQKAGYNPAKCNGDKLFYLNIKTDEYEPLTPRCYENILKGSIRF